MRMCVKMDERLHDFEFLYLTLGIWEFDTECLSLAFYFFVVVFTSLKNDVDYFCTKLVTG